jgi:hypothetical protein
MSALFVSAPQVLPRNATLNRQHPLANKLRHFWGAQQPDGSGVLRNATGKANGAFSAGQSWALKNGTNGVLFNGTSHITLGGNGEGSPESNSNFSLFFEFTAPDTATSQVIYASTSSGCIQITIFNNALHSVLSGTAIVASDTTTLTPGKKYTAVISDDGTTTRFYINGVFSSSTAAHNIGAVNTAYILGATYGGNTPVVNGFFLGYFGVYDKILSPGEVWALHQNPWQIFTQTRPALPLSWLTDGSINIALAGTLSDAEQLTGNLALTIDRSGTLSDAEQLVGGLSLTIAKAGTLAEAEQLTGSVSLVTNVLGILPEIEQLDGSASLVTSLSGVSIEVEQLVGAASIYDALLVSGLCRDIEQLFGVFPSVTINLSGALAESEQLPSSTLSSAIALSGALAEAERLGGYRSYIYIPLPVEGILRDIERCCGESPVIVTVKAERILIEFLSDSVLLEQAPDQVWVELIF